MHLSDALAQAVRHCVKDLGPVCLPEMDSVSNHATPSPASRWYCALIAITDEKAERASRAESLKATMVGGGSKE